MLRLKDNCQKIVALVIDSVLLQTGFVMAYFLRFGLTLNYFYRFWEPYRGVMIYYTLVQIFLIYYYGLYRESKYWSSWEILERVVKAVSLGTVVLVFIAFFARAFGLPRSIVIISWFSNTLLLTGWRWAVLFIRNRRKSKKVTLIYGTGRIASLIAQELQERPSLGYQLVGFIRRPPGITNPKILVEPMLGTLEEVEEIVKKYKVKEVIFAPDQRSNKELAEIMRKCTSVNVNTRIVPEIFEITSDKLHLEHFPLSSFAEVGFDLSRNWYLAIKRSIDVLLSFTALILAIPLFPIIVFIIKNDSPGPIILKQKRTGKNGKSFIMYKFRTMVTHAEEKIGPVWAKTLDKRITRIGRLLRRTHLDELPQLINVLKGEMSLIGPRPERPEIVSRLEKEIPYYDFRHQVRPGIMGWAQLMRKFQSDQSLDDARDKLQYDLYYIKNLSLALDLRILVQSVWKLLTGT